MTDYKNIRGKKVKFLTSDLDNAQGEGQIFYSDTSSEYKVAVAVGAWSASGNLITGRNDLAGFGTQTATACFGGVDATAVSNDTEEYNGSGWAAGEDMPSAVYEHAGTGTLTAGLSVGGTLPGGITDATNEYDGTDWAAGGDYPAATIRVQACGTQTAALAAGGGRPTISAVVCEYNGSAWTANPSPSGDLPAAVQYHRMTGILTSAVSFGGGPSGPVTGATATYNGTTWTAQTATLNDTRSRLGGAGETDSSSVAFGGFAPNGTVNTELWDGSSWTEVGNMGTARYALAGTGTKSSALGSGGYTSGRLAATEEWNFSVEAVTAGAWASGNNANTARYHIEGAGTQTAGLSFGGFTYPSPGVVQKALTESYDGTNWTEVGDLNTARSDAGSMGTQTAALLAGGSTPPNVTVAETFDGSSWTEVGDLNTARSGLSGCGTTTAGLAVGRGSPDSGGFGGETEEYDGTSWTESGDLNTARAGCAATGTQTAGLAFGGNKNPSVTLADESEEYNGTAWTEGNNLITARRDKLGGAGIQTAALAFGGNTVTNAGKPTSAATEGYDGTTWSTRPSMSAGKRSMASYGTQTLALGSHGYTTGQTNTTEEFTGDTTSINLKTITDS